jgi:hypothetical protein
VRPIRIVVLAALAITLYGQATPKDVDGWDRVKWGMTIAEARAAYAIAAEPEIQNNWTLLELNPIKLAGVQLGVQLGAREGEAGKISLVRLWSFFGLPTSPPLAGAQDFDTLKSALIEKYGHPATEDVQRGENFRLLKTVHWTFPSTSILLSLEQSSSLPNIGNIYLDYSPARQ